MQMMNHILSKNKGSLLQKALSVKAIILDVDGVLMRSIDATGRYFWSKNAKVDLGLTSEHFKKIFSSDWTEVTRGQMDTRVHLDKVFKEMALTLTAEAFLDYWLSRDSQVDHDVLTFIKTDMPKDVALYIGTNQDTYRTAHIRTFFAPHVKEIFSSCEIGFVKPENGFYEHIESSLALVPQDILLIDDTLENIKGATSRGWKTHFYH